ncbi:rubredoxin-like domain-containing protein [Bacilliculturomica massiliensis]|uniref:rubredoxin-like domain-containing protein n=1 Tax=Bacilliculturomica massiliensis TaxID=1917867 RepID=UPI0010323064|nr:rubredoxin [Bacilliculturomica massiliensis]
MLWKCSVCGYIAEGDKAPEKCPKCGAPADKFTAIEGEAAKKIIDADRTNDIHHEIAVYAAKIAELCKEGLAINLDPGCNAAFAASKNRAWEIKQMVKAEIAGHVGKEKY